MKPGVSTSTTSGMPKRSHRFTNQAPFSDAGESITPAIRFGWLAMMPTGRPSMRVSAVYMFGAQRGASSSTEPASAIARATAPTS